MSFLGPTLYYRELTAFHRTDISCLVILSELSSNVTFEPTKNG